MNTLRTGISDTVNEVNKLLPLARNDEELKRLRQLRRALFAVWQEVIVQEIDRGTKEFVAATELLESARRQATSARDDRTQIPAAITLGVAATKAVDAVVGLGFDWSSE